MVGLVRALVSISVVGASSVEYHSRSKQIQLIQLEIRNSTQIHFIYWFVICRTAITILHRETTAKQNLVTHRQITLR